MANAFSIAMATIFADPNMAVEATYLPFGGGATLGLRAIRRAPDEMMQYGETAILTDTQIIEAQVADLASPQEGDVFQIGSENLQLRGEPVRDTHRLVWLLQLVPVP